MVRTLIAICGLALASVAGAQQDIPSLIRNAKEPVRVKIRFADPWMIKAVLEGNHVRHPEISTILGTQSLGGGGQAGGFGGGQMGGGQMGGGAGGLGAGQMGGGQRGGGQMGGGQMGGGQMGPGGGGNQGGFGGQGGAGGTGGVGGQGNSLLPPGWTVMVNPTDNSLWLIPPRN